MPELPEVETVRMGLAAVLEHRRITRVETRRGDLRVPFPPRLAERLNGRDVKRLSRRAKYLLADLDSGETLIMHLGMSGRFSVHAKGAELRIGNYVYEPAKSNMRRGAHDHVIIETDAPAEIVFTDPRRFGLMLLLDTASLGTNPLFDTLGPEPLSRAFTAKFLERALGGRRTPIKTALLDQRTVAGLGNIYVCEALFHAGISPKRMAATVGGGRAAALVRAIRSVLRAAIRAGGSSLRDFVGSDGASGYFQQRHWVYDRSGQPCRRCRTPIRKLVQGQRATYYCSRCQR